MRRAIPVLIVVLTIALGACSKQAPEVSVNAQVPAAMQIAETEGAEEGEGGGGGGASFAEADAVWVADSLAPFVEAPSTLPADGAVLGLELLGGLPHNVVFEDFQGNQILVEGTGEGQYAGSAAIPAGTYIYYCSIAGHRAGGMEGEITVE